MSTKTTIWRLIETASLDGPGNMAVDEAILLSFDPRRSAPVLRLYGWDPPAISCGRYQRPHEALDLERCAARGVPAIRRVTGGGIIYHAEELTYSIVCAPCHIPQASSVKESFRILTGFLCRFYARLGLDPSYAVERQGEERAPFCFAGRESYDILVNGRKIGGNAQRRLRRVIFQHGSIPLSNCLPVAVPFLRDKPAGLEESVTSLAEEGIKPDIALLKKELAAAFSENFNVTFDRDGLTGEELAMAGALRANKYTSDAWNLYGK
jgi:lipoate-protein ligase A